MLFAVMWIIDCTRRYRWSPDRAPQGASGRSVSADLQDTVFRGHRMTSLHRDRHGVGWGWFRCRATIAAFSVGYPAPLIARSTYDL